MTAPYLTEAHRAAQVQQGGGARRAMLTPQNLLAETYPSQLLSSNAVLTSQTIYATMLMDPLINGDVVTNIVLAVGVAGAGTVPTTFKVALLDSAAKVVAASGNLNNSASLTATGKNLFALSAPYTVPTSGAYYIAVLQDGAFATTPVQIGRGGTATPLTVAPAGGVQAVGSQTGQTNFPAVGAAVTLGTVALTVWGAVN